LTKINLAPYNQDELFDILKDNLGELQINNQIAPLIKEIFRGHPRNCVEIAEDLQKYAAAKSISKINEDHWKEFCEIMGIHAHGFNEAEMMIVRILGERGESSLEALAASTGFSKNVIRGKYEHVLLSKGILEISGKRSLTPVGRQFYRKMRENI
jgi:Holliday junction resolvasome RuvABC ATP-dependent DNA helicase subunit